MALVNRILLRGINPAGLLLRLASMAGKFVLIIYLTQAGLITELGIFGIFISSTVLFSYVFGLEFHAYSTRELIVSSQSRRSNLILTQFILFACMYLISLPFVYLVFEFQFIAWEYMLCFCFIAILSHFGLEIQRILVALSKPTLGYLVAFFMHGLWAPIVVLVLIFAPVAKPMNVIFYAWSLSVLCGAILGGVLLNRVVAFDLKNCTPDWNWVINGARACARFFVATLAFKVIELSDRYVIQFYQGDAAVGMYTFFSSMSNIAYDVVYTLIVVAWFPMLIREFRDNKVEKFLIGFGEFKAIVLKLALMLIPLIALAMYILVEVLDRDEFKSEFITFLVLIFANFAFVLSLIPHYLLYAAGQDRELMRIAVFAMLLNVTFNLIFVPIYGILGAAVGTLLALVTILLLKVFYGRKILAELKND